MIRQLIRRVAGTREFWVVLAATGLSIVHLALIGNLALTSTVNPIELEWTLAALVGVCYSTWFVHDTLLDLQAGQASGHDGETERAAFILIVTALLLLVVHVLFLGLGALALLSPPRPGAAPLLLTAYGIAYVVVGQLLVYGLSLIHRLRTALLRPRRRAPLRGDPS